MRLSRGCSRRQFAKVEHDIYGLSYTEGDTMVYARTDDAVGMVANAGVDDEVVVNDFDNTLLFGNIRKVEDVYGNKFVRIPKLYIKKTVDGADKTLQISLTKRLGFYLPWCFWDFEKNRELPYVDVGCYPGSLSDDGKLESKPNTFPLRRKNIVDFRGYAVANGAGYQQLDIHVVDLLRTLAAIEFATFDIQAIMKGYSEGQYANNHLATVAETETNRFILANNFADLYRVGQYISIGTSQGGDNIAVDRQITDIDAYDVDNKAVSFDGALVNIAVGNFLYNSVWKNGACDNVAASSGSIVANDGKYPCVYRGIENPFGNLWQFIDGININNGHSWVCKNAAQYASNVFASSYEQLSYVNHNKNGYVTAMGHDVALPFAELPTAISASYVGYKDYFYQNATGQFIARFGGSWSIGSVAGLSCWALSSSSAYAYLSFGGRLLKKPL